MSRKDKLYGSVFDGEVWINDIQYAIQAHTSPVWVQHSFRGRNDDGSETTATWKASANTNWSQAVSTTFRVRFIVQNTAATFATTSPTIYQNLNSAGWEQVTSGTAVVSATSSNVANDDATTEQLSGPQGFVAGAIVTDGIAPSVGLNAQDTEFEFVLSIVASRVVNNDSIQLRLQNGNTAFDTYSNVPTITVVESASYDDSISPSVTAAYSTAGNIQIEASISPAASAGFSTVGGKDVTGDISASVTAAITEAVDLTRSGDITLSATAATTKAAQLDAVGSISPSVTAAYTNDTHGSDYNPSVSLPGTAGATFAVTNDAVAAISAAVTAALSFVGNLDMQPAITLSGTAGYTNTVTLDRFGSITIPVSAAVAFVDSLGGTPQFARPISDQSKGGWTPSTGTDLYPMIDETEVNDSDYIMSSSSPVADKCKIKFNHVGDPQTSADHKVRYRYRSGGDILDSLTVRLVQGASTVIAEWVHNNVNSTYVTATQTLTGTQADNITNYADLYIEFEADD